MSAQIIPLHAMTESSAVAGEAQSMQNLRARAWSNFYAAERRDGTEPRIAHQRANHFITNRFEGLVDDIREIMAEPR